MPAKLRVKFVALITTSLAHGGHLRAGPTAVEVRCAHHDVSGAQRTLHPPESQKPNRNALQSKGNLALFLTFSYIAPICAIGGLSKPPGARRDVVNKTPLGLFRTF